MYFDGLSYRAVARNMGDHFNLDTGPTTVHRWVQEYSDKASDITKDYPVQTGDEWVADEVAVKVGGKQYWLFNVMDADSRFVLAAYLSPERTREAAQTALAMARDRANNAPETVKTDGLKSYQEAMRRVFPTHPVKHVVSQGIRAKINNNLSERLQGTFRDRDKTLRSLKKQDTGQRYVDGLVLDYNYFRPHMGLEGKTPAASAGADAPFSSWADIATLRDQLATPDAISIPVAVASAAMAPSPRVESYESTDGVLLIQREGLTLYHGTVQPEGTLIDAFKATYAMPMPKTAAAAYNTPGEKVPALTEVAGVWLTESTKIADSYTAPRWGADYGEGEQGQLYEVALDDAVIARIAETTDETVRDALSYEPDALFMEDRNEVLVLDPRLLTISSVTDQYGDEIG